MVKAMPRPIYCLELANTHCVGGRASGQIWTGTENLAVPGIRSPDYPPPSESL